MKKTEKTVDAVKLMRQIRDEMSREIEDMSYEEQKRYLSDGPVKPSKREQTQDSGSQEAT